MKLIFGIILVSCVFALCFMSSTNSYAKQSEFYPVPKDSTVFVRTELLDLLKELDKSKLVSKRVEEIPTVIQTYIESISKSFSIANADEEYQAGCVGSGNLPRRQLMYFGCSENLALMTYKSGGYAPSEHIILLKYSEDKVESVWSGNLCSRGFSSKKEILKLLQSQDVENFGLKDYLNSL